MQLARQIVERLTAEGASMVGFGNLESLEPNVRQGLPVGISIAVALDPGIVERVAGGPTTEYDAEYDRVNSLLDRLAELCAEMLRSAGHTAAPMKATWIELDRATLSSPLPHKTAATRAGLGWIGRCALLITEDYGSAVRLNTVLTDADLPLSDPVEESRCGSCSECMDVCPGSAPRGAEWSSGVAREDIYDAFACFTTARGLSKDQGIEHILCGKCIAACPWTKGYLARS